jgi:Zn ribbon nucleic-acid-binding protein
MELTANICPRHVETLLYLAEYYPDGWNGFCRLLAEYMEKEDFAVNFESESARSGFWHLEGLAEASRGVMYNKYRIRTGHKCPRCHEDMYKLYIEDSEMECIHCWYANYNASEYFDRKRKEYETKDRQ